MSHPLVIMICFGISQTASARSQTYHAECCAELPANLEGSSEHQQRLLISFQESMQDFKYILGEVKIPFVSV